MLTDEFRAALGWQFEDSDVTIRSEEFCRRQREDALENFDLNMAFFAQIPAEAFEDALTELLRKNKSLRPVTELRALEEDEGVYVMVLDDYRQAYIGQAVDMRRRIKAHWSGTKQFDRLIGVTPKTQCCRLIRFVRWTPPESSQRAQSEGTPWRPDS